MQAYLLGTFLEFLGPSGHFDNVKFPFLFIFSFFNIYLAALNLSSSMKGL